MFTVFDRDALIQALKSQTGKVQRIGSTDNARSTTYQPMSIDQWDEIMTGQVSGRTAAERTNSIMQTDDPIYADEIPPFDVTISFAN